MELQWNQTGCAFLRRELWETQNLEEVQEVRLPEDLPDIGRIICAWGQPVLRSKEWKNDAIAASGGVVCWVLYAPEDGSEPKCLDVWIPFHAKWSLQDGHREGHIRLSCCLRSVDARTRSARKMAVRASLGVQVEAMVPAKESISSPGEIPDGLQLLEKTYPAMLPKEAGEKVFSLEEDVPIIGLKPEKILFCQIFPEVTERNVIGSRAVFKGNCALRILYTTENGSVESCLKEFPFAQYADLDNDYDKNPILSVVMAVSSLDTEILEDAVHIKCGLVAQYLVHDRQLIRVAEDCYSLEQAVTPVLETPVLPVMLDQTQTSLKVPVNLPNEAKELLDCSFFPDHPVQFREGNTLCNHMGGICQTLYRDMEGNLQSTTENWCGEWNLPLEEECSAFVRLMAVLPSEDGQMGVKLEALSVSNQEIPMITDIHTGEKKEADPDRPSLVIRRAGECSLWELAKRCGTTVSTIQKVNQLTGEPEKDTMLLIPIP